MQRNPLSNNNLSNQMDRRENRSEKRSNPDTLSMNPSVPSLTPAQMYSNFEEWIKMCTDNVGHHNCNIKMLVLMPF
jgi:condensin complex subunit 2